MSTYDTYEYVGYIIPGAILLVGVMFFCRWIRTQFEKGSPAETIGSFIIIAFVLGHMLHATAHWIEARFTNSCEGNVRGTNLVINDRQNQDLLSAAELTDLTTAVSTRYKVKMETLDLQNKVDLVEWCNVLWRIGIDVHAVKKGALSDIFIRDYGLYLGLATAISLLLLCSLLVVLFPRFRPKWITSLEKRRAHLKWPLVVAMFSVLIILDALMLWRLHYFGRLYARQLFLALLSL
ncbi:MAG: hypothetical protein WAM62_09320 [Pseudolabrys sp.]